MLLNSLPLDGLRVFGELIKAGASAWRLSFYGENPETAAERIAAFQNALCGGAPGPRSPPLPGIFPRGCKNHSKRNKK